MAALVVPQAALVRIIWSMSGQSYAVNVIGTRKTGATVIDQTTANSVGAQIKSAYTSSGLAGLNTNIELATVGVRDISSASNVEFMDSGAAAASTGVGASLPPQVAYCVTLRTARAGKSYRGRVYLPGFGVSQLELGGTAVAAVRDNSVNFLNALRTGLPSNGLSLAIVSRKLSSTELVTSVQGRDLVWDTIRGRATAGI